MLEVGFLLTPLFIIFLYISLKFIWGEEGKDERGIHISNISYKRSFPIFLIGWLIIELFHKYIQPLSLEIYRDSLWVVILVTCIIQGSVIVYYKRKV
ncbi:hypothetical protein [Cytobacillus sp. IB215316]|uniref:hypothetical protein n=1 Tax=Cytobacillus sp. IB215316 TaxID=3097354 RepID=UPI002A16968B|nr:hypothetical protein [Cytobacillus sp. IB215316]MDX8361765.1 hypothetical protein [Cytobacillus sp. IB215316]